MLVVLHQHAKSFGLETTEIDVGEHVDLVSIEQVFDFGSGCICCSPDGDLTRLLCDIAGSNSSSKITHIFIETTGVADVRSFARLFQVEESISPFFNLKGVITIINSNTVSTIPNSKDSSCRELNQLKAANLLVENNFSRTI